MNGGASGIPDAAPPAQLFDQENEIAVLSCLLFDNKQVDRVAEVLVPADFGYEILGAIYGAILQEVAAGRPAIVGTISKILGADERFEALGGRATLALWSGSHTAVFSPLPFAQAVKEIADRRRLWLEMRRSIDELADMAIPTIDVAAGHEQRLMAGADLGQAVTFHSASDCIDEVIASFGRDRGGVLSGVVEGIDRLIGNIQPGWLGILAARPGAGKTATLLSYLRGSASRGHASLYISLEVGWETLSTRIVSDSCHAFGAPVAYASILNGRVQDHQVREICRLKEDVASLPLRIVDQGCDTIGGLRRVIRRHKRALAAVGRSLELVIIDYLQLLSPDQRNLPETEAITRVSRELKLMAMSEGVAIIAAAQLNREVEKRADKRPILPDLRSSGQIEADADFVIFLLSQEYYHVESKPRENDPAYPQWEEKLFLIQNELEFICAKFRHGPTGNFFGKFYRQYQAVR